MKQSISHKLLDVLYLNFRDRHKNMPDVTGAKLGDFDALSATTFHVSNMIHGELREWSYK